MRRTLLALVAMLAVLAGCAEPPRSMTEPPGVVITRDLVYRRVETSALALDLYRPSGQSGPLPAVVWIHGGGWFRGKKDQCPIASLALHGYVIAAIDYRVTREAVFPAQIQDCKAAVRWLRAHAAELRIDPERIGAFGSSAGGHLAALLGTTDGMPGYDQPLPGEPLEPAGVRCVCAFFPPTDLGRLARDDDPRYSRIRMAIPWLLGASAQRRPEAATAASPVACAGPWAAPFLIFHGRADETVPIEQSRLLVAALARWRVEATLIELDGAGHDDLIWGRPEVQQAAIAFLDRHLQPERLGSAPALAQTVP
jgi:acetyl esterase/lipase